MLAARLGRAYPAETLETIWKEVLLYQFHDILPGSSIKRVYDESLARYEELLGQTETMIADTYSYLAGHIAHGKTAFAQTVIFNSLPWERREWLRVNGRWHHVQVPSMGYAVLSNDAGHEADGEAASSSEILTKTPGRAQTLQLKDEAWRTTKSL